MLLELIAAILSALASAGAGTEVQSEARQAPEATAVTAERPAIDWRPSIALGEPFSGGRLVNGVKLPASGPDWFTWDPVRKRSPNRAWRRWGTDTLIRTVLRVARQHRAANPSAPRLTIGDLSRPHGGDFGPQYGSIGHASHQNGLDVDIYYPRRDRAERAPRRVSQIDRKLSQDLVRRFVRAGAEHVFVGPNTGLRGPPGVVQALIHHDDHMHVRIHNPLPPSMRDG
jgi:murein endopeptidase